MKANLRRHYETLLDFIAIYQSRINNSTASQEDIDDLAITITRAKTVKANLEKI